MKWSFLPSIRVTLGKAREALDLRLPPGAGARFRCMSLEEFFTALDAPAPTPEKSTLAGYKVKVRYRPQENEAAGWKLPRRSDSASALLQVGSQSEPTT